VPLEEVLLRSDVGQCFLPGKSKSLSFLLPFKKTVFCVTKEEIESEITNSIETGVRAVGKRDPSAKPPCYRNHEG